MNDLCIAFLVATFIFSLSPLTTLYYSPLMMIIGYKAILTWYRDDDLISSLSTCLDKYEVIVDCANYFMDNNLADHPHLNAKIPSLKSRILKMKTFLETDRYTNNLIKAVANYRDIKNIANNQNVDIKAAVKFFTHFNISLISWIKLL